jgi:hypothetical protein
MAPRLELPKFCPYKSKVKESGQFCSRKGKNKNKKFCFKEMKKYPRKLEKSQIVHRKCTQFCRSTIQPNFPPEEEILWSIGRLNYI